MNATVIDTLRFANRLKEAGFEPARAEGMACALGDELADRMVTRRDVDEFKIVVDARFDAVDARFDAVDARFDSLDAKFDAKFDALDVKIDSVQREMSGKFNVLATVMALGFTLLAGLVGYSATLHSSAEGDGTTTQAVTRPAD